MSVTSLDKQQLKQLRVRAEALTVRNDREGYDSFWADDELVDLYLEPGRRANFQLVADLCADWSGDAIDLGCGSGTMLAELIARDRTGQKRISGIDYSPAAVARCSALLPQGKFFEADICHTNLPDESFDLILSMQTMEHLPDPAAAFDEMWRLVRPRGRIVITIPNGAIDDWEGHCNFWTADSFSKTARREADLVRKFNDDRNLLFVFEKPM